MSSTARIFSILDLFTQSTPILSPDDINQALGYSRPTGYRYVKELVKAGYLQKVSAGYYSLGPRIIELDYQLRQSDPLLLNAAPVMEKLSEQSGFDTVLSVYYPSSMKVIDIHRYHNNAQDKLKLTYGRGRPRPLFSGASPKVLLSTLTKAQQKKLYQANSTIIEKNKLGKTEDEFLQNLQHIKKSGFYYSRGELESNVDAIAMAIDDPEKEVKAALALVGQSDSFDKHNIEILRYSLELTTKEISESLTKR